MRCLAINYPKTDEDEQTIKKLVTTYESKHKDKVLEDDANFEMPELDMAREGNNTQMASFGTQMKWLGFRNRALLKREPQAGRAKVGNMIFTALLIIIIYWQVGGPTGMDLQNFAGSVFFWLVGLLMSTMFNTILIFQAERDVFLRENANQMYGIGAYYLSKNMIEMPTAILMSGFQLAAIYFAVGYRADNWIPEFFQVWLCGFLVIQCALSYGYFVSCSVEKMEMATAIAPMLTMPAIMFGGFFANSNTYTAAVAWMKYISPVYYANCGILIA